MKPTEKPTDLERLYSFSEAAKLIPSARGGTVLVQTVHRWRRMGFITAYRRKLGNVESWFLPESEIIRLRGQAVPATAAVEEPAIPSNDDGGERCRQLLYSSTRSHKSKRKPRETPPGQAEPSVVSPHASSPGRPAEAGCADPVESDTHASSARQREEALLADCQQPSTAKNVPASGPKRGRKRVWPPKVYPHPSGQDRIRVRINGKAKDIWLGRSGTPEARQEYLRVVGEIEANNWTALPSTASPGHQRGVRPDSRGMAVGRPQRVDLA